MDAPRPTPPTEELKVPVEKTGNLEQLVDLQVGQPFKWQARARDNDFDGIYNTKDYGPIKRRPSMRDGFVIFGSTDLLKDGQTPKLFVVVSAANDIVRSIITVEEGPQAKERASQLIDQAKGRT